MRSYFGLAIAGSPSYRPTVPQTRMRRPGRDAGEVGAAVERHQEPSTLVVDLAPQQLAVADGLHVDRADHALGRLRLVRAQPTGRRGTGR
jgi:hypothetical protein